MPITHSVPHGIRSASTALPEPPILPSRISILIREPAGACIPSRDTSGFTVVAVENKENVSYKWYSLNAIQAVDKLSSETTKLTPEEEAERARGYRGFAEEEERVAAPNGLGAQQSPSLLST